MSNNLIWVKTPNTQPFRVSYLLYLKFSDRFEKI